MVAKKDNFWKQNLVWVKIMFQSINKGYNVSFYGCYIECTIYT